LNTDAGSIRVNIFNQTYSLRSASGDGDRVERVARLVDERMHAVASGLAVHDVAKVAVLTALNLADELEGLKSFYETELREIIARAREEDEPQAHAASDSDSTQERFEQPPASFDAPTGDEAKSVAASDEQSWFEAIFETDAPSKSSEERLSSQVSSRLRSQVSARLRRLRQPSPGNSITEGEGGEHQS
jgi:cell division protein ZapA (FtsZ GTPase activity inhibitor)